MEDSGCLMEEDVEVELDSGFCVEVVLAQMSDREELDWLVITGDSVFASDEQREGGRSPGGCGGSQTQEEGEMEAESGSAENGETEAERGEEVDDQTEQEETEGALDVCLMPVEERGVHVRISLEEVERYYRFICCCRWLRGRCQIFFFIMFSHILCVTVIITRSPQSYGICSCEEFPLFYTDHTFAP